MITSLSQLDLNKIYTYADYLTWQVEERVELIKGKILAMSPAPSRRHQQISGVLYGELYIFLKKSSCKAFHAPFDVRLAISQDLEVSKKYKKQGGQLSDGKVLTVVQPGICVICDESQLDDRGGIGAPELVIEILSPGNTRKEMKDKFEIYQESGVEEYWLVEPYDEFIIVYSLNDGAYIGSPPYVSGDVIKSKVIAGFEFLVSDIFK